MSKAKVTDSAVRKSAKAVAARQAKGVRRAAKRIAKKQIQKVLKVKPGDVVKRDLAKLIDRAMKRYGETTLEDRSIPDGYDGLKPVHRRVLWSAFKMGLKPTGDVVKSARIVGDVIGKFHPHGDLACYGALVSMVNFPVPLFDGTGCNFGSLVDMEASMRYTNTRLTAFSEAIYFNPEYIRVTKLIPNYDYKDEEPILLPALLPMILVNAG
jgi:DNA gyrase/topoisomerase IV subunit A